jgi:hypothetical protein
MLELQMSADSLSLSLSVLYNYILSGCVPRSFVFFPAMVCVEGGCLVAWLLLLTIYLYDFFFAKIIVLLSQPKDTLKSIGMYVTKSQWKSATLPQQSLVSSDLVTKAAFRKSPEV